VVDKLAELAHADGALVLAALHAPRSASFARIDDLLLLVRLRIATALRALIFRSRAAAAYRAAPQR
jgi:hypothetical protein